MMRKSDGSVKDEEKIAELSRILERNKNAFLQILLTLCKDKTYDRILCCPRFPVSTITRDLDMKLQLFRSYLLENPFEIPSLLASLFDSVTTDDYRKTHGQYFTPSAVAREAIELLSVKSGDILLDAGSGTGIFAAAILEHMYRRSEDPWKAKYLGIENDPILALSTAASLDWINAPSNWMVLYADYLDVSVLYLKNYGFLPNAIVSNPPFVRSNRLGERSRLARSLGLSGFAGLHSFFLAHSAELLRKGRMVFVLPLEMDETRYGSALLQDLRASFRIEEKSISRDRERGWIVTGKSRQPPQDKTSENLVARLVKFESLPGKKEDRVTSNVILSHSKATQTLSSIADIHRGISTGANSFFVMTDEKVKALDIPFDYLRRIFPPKIPRNELPEVFGLDEWREFRDQGRPCWLLYVKPNLSMEKLPSQVRKYIREGERSGINRIPTCANRRSWYSLGNPGIPELVFTYMVREKPRFVFNKAHALNLTNFLGIFLKAYVDKSLCDKAALVSRLNFEVAEWTRHNSVGRRYAGGLINIGPGDLSEMPISRSIFAELGIKSLDFPAL